jgi:hypothetical protein
VSQKTELLDIANYRYIELLIGIEYMEDLGVDGKITVLSHRNRAWDYGLN